MINWIKKLKVLIAGLFIIPIAFAATSIDIEKEVVIKDAYKLKADKEKILDSKEIDWVEDVLDEEGLPTGEVINKGKIRQYAYISDVEVATGTIKIQDGKKEKTIIEKVDKRTGNARFYETGKKIDGKKEMIGEFYSGTPFIKQDDKWYYTETATTTTEAYELQTKDTLKEKISRLFINFTLADTTYFYPSDDESIYLTGTPWSTIRTSSSGTLRGLTYVNVVALRYDSTDYLCERYGATINTSSLSGATISAASYNVYGVDTSNGSLAKVYKLYNSSHSDTIVGDDYNDFGTTEWSSNSFSTDTFTDGSYNTFNLNTTGLAGINKSGNTKLSIREKTYDVDGATPGTTEWDYIRFYNVTEAGTSKDPYLSVTYTEADEGYNYSYIIEF